MTTFEIDAIARALVAPGKGLLAADETPTTLGKRLEAYGVESSAESRRDFREMLFGARDIGAFISGVILQDETIHQKSSRGQPLVELLTERGIIPGIKVDAGTVALAGAPGERITEGLDGLRPRLRDYYRMGARFAKWRAVISIGDSTPSSRCVRANAAALARYAALCQEQGLVPIVEPEVLMAGAHGLARCEEVTGYVLHDVFDALFEQGVRLEGLLLKPSMVTPGSECVRRASIDEVAAATVRTLVENVPPAVPGVVFLSGGQRHILSTEHLAAINRVRSVRPWTLTFSYGRALQDEALEAWRGKAANVRAAQRAFHHRARCVSAAALASYTSAMERAAA